MDGNGSIPIIGARPPKVKKSDFATVANVEAFLTQALKKQDEIHNFYLQQLPEFVARMIVDGLIAHGLIPAPPSVPSDAPPAPAENVSQGAEGSAIPTAASDTPAPSPSQETAQ